MIEEDTESALNKAFWGCCCCCCCFSHFYFLKFHSLSNKTLRSLEREGIKDQTKASTDIYEIEMSDAKDFQD